MEDLDRKNVSQIRFEFDDGTWFILDHMSLRHVKMETKMELDFALSKIYEEIKSAGERAKQLEKESKGFDLGINTSDDVDSKDVGPGQK